MLRQMDKAMATETIQKMAARLVAVSPAGSGLQLVGGFRYRLLDNSPRRSDDIDYHTTDGLAEKRDALVALFRRRLLPEVKRSLGYDGDVRAADGPGDGSTVVSRLEMAFYQTGTPHSRIQIPVEVVRLYTADPPQSLATDGAIVLTMSNQDMIESKILALLNRQVIEARDFVDIFLYRNQLGDDSRDRLAAKLADAGVTRAQFASRLDALHTRRDIDIRNIGAVLEQQVDDHVRAAIEQGGGAAQVHDTALAAVESLLTPLPEQLP